MYVFILVINEIITLRTHAIKHINGTEVSKEKYIYGEFSEITLRNESLPKWRFIYFVLRSGLELWDIVHAVRTVTRSVELVN